MMVFIVQTYKVANASHF